MLEVVPTILEHDPDIFVEQFERLNSHVRRLHLDFADGSMAASRTILPEDLMLLDHSNMLGAHLMVRRPSQYFSDLAKQKFQCVIVHFEVDETLEELIKEAYEYRLAIAVAVKPQTPVEHVFKFADKVKYIQLMGVNPGYSGRPFLNGTYSRIKRLRQACPNVEIAVDGGVRFSNALDLLQAGASTLMVGKGGYAANCDPLKGLAAWQNYVKQLEVIKN